jgi:hypothetical protein
MFQCEAHSINDANEICLKNNMYTLLCGWTISLISVSVSFHQCIPDSLTRRWWGIAAYVRYNVVWTLCVYSFNDSHVLAGVAFCQYWESIITVAAREAVPLHYSGKRILVRWNNLVILVSLVFSLYYGGKCVETWSGILENWWYCKFVFWGMIDRFFRFTSSLLLLWCVSSESGSSIFYRPLSIIRLKAITYILNIISGDWDTRQKWKSTTINRQNESYLKIINFTCAASLMCLMGLLLLLLGSQILW